MKGKFFRASCIALLLAVAIIGFVPEFAFADVNNFTVTNFDANYYLTNADPQGEMRVVEKISVDFTDQNHGILRALPESYHNNPLKLHVNRVSSESGAPAQYSTYESNGNKVLKIGDPNRTVTGVQEYTVDYTEQNVISFYKNHDELYWNVNGTQWDQPFTKINATVHLPAGLQMWNQPPQCYTGSYGSTSRHCTVSTNGNQVNISALSLAPQSNLTFVAGFQKGFFQPMSWRDRVRDYLPDGLELVSPILLVGGAGLIWWLKRGRDAKGRGVIVPEYDAPDGLSPLEVGSIIDFSVDNRDLTATIIDLAIRGYIKIIENNAKKLVVIRKSSYSLELANKNWEGLNGWERQIMEGLFSGSDVGDQVDIAALKTKLNTEANSIRKSVSQSLTANGYFRSNPIKYIGLSVISVVLLAAFIGPAFHGVQALLLLGFGIGLVVFAMFFKHLPARTAKGVAAKEHILGLKMYLEVAEKDRIAKLQSPDAPYAEKSGGPKHTVELFEKLLPYAIVLKVEEQWAGKFKDIYKTPPDWYGGNFAAFNAGYLAGSLGSGFQSALNSSFASPQSSGSSGFGGGFSGGGGGGGGGGGW